MMRSLGAIVVDPADLPSADEIAVSNNETIVLDVDFKVNNFLVWNILVVSPFLLDLLK